MMPSDKVVYAEKDKPDIFGGAHEVEVRFVRAETDGQAPDDPDLPQPGRMPFAIEGPPRTVAPGQIAGRFPPRNATGPLDRVVPHLALHDSKLPWARGSDPWLALVLVVDGEPVRFATEADGAQRLHVDDNGMRNALFGLTPPGEHGGAAEALRPAMGRLAHVRRFLPGGAAPQARQQAVLLCTRAIKAGESGRICLLDIGPDAAAGAALPTSFPCLHAWRYHADASTEARFEQIFRDFSAPAAEPGDGPRVPGFALPCPPAPADAPWASVVAERHRLGFAALPWRTRSGLDTAAWYRGPLVPLGAMPEPPGQAPSDMPLHADALVSDDPVSGLADASHAAAFEFGRLHALSNVTLRAAILGWRRRCARACHLHACHAEPARGMAHTHCGPDTTMPPFPRAAFEPLARLEPLPVSYLVPDERLAPVESLRAVALDPVWLYRMLQGAFSLGAELFRCSSSDGAAGRLGACEAGALDALAALAALGEDAPRREGYLLRSQALSLWPAMKITARDAEGAEPSPLPGMPREIAPEMHLALYPRALAELTFDQPTMEVHFEAPRADGSDPRMWQALPEFATKTASVTCAAQLRAPRRRAVFRYAEA